MTFSPSKVILDAVQFAAEAEIGHFGRLVAQNASILTRQLSLRILLSYLPESTPPSNYSDLLRDLAEGRSPVSSSSNLPQPSKDLNEAVARARVKALQLQSLTSDVLDNHSASELDKFIISRARKIESELGSITLVQQLVQPFVQQSQSLKDWTISILIPLTRLDYDYYPQQSRAFTLHSFEQLHGRMGVEALLERVVEHKNRGKGYCGRDLKNIVGPWIYGEACRNSREGARDKPAHSDTTKIEPQMEDSLSLCWVNVYEWLLEKANVDFSLVLEFFQEWGGPRDVDYGGIIENAAEDQKIVLAEKEYAQLGLAIFYRNPHSEIKATENTFSILTKVANLTGLLPPPNAATFDMNSFLSSLTSEYLATVSTVHLLPTELLDPSNLLVAPSSDALELAFIISASIQLLDSLSHPLAPATVVNLSLFASQTDQQETFRRTIRSASSRSSANDKTWAEMRQKFLWLRAWQASGEPPLARHGLFAQIERNEFEIEILKALVNNSRYKLAATIYCESSSDPLPKDIVEQVLLEQILASYDNASNGNRTRGGIKKAIEILSSFNSFFPNSVRFHRALALINATHRLSFYSLTLQHGVPFLPVNIRIHSSPLNLIDKVLKQNPGSYTKLEDLLDIGRDFVRAGLVRLDVASNADENQQLDQVQRNITAKAIEASLNEDDFDTAYSYIVSRLATSRTMEDEPTDTSKNATTDQDVLWKAAYQAGRYRPKNKSGTSELRRLEQRMELLSQALLLAPTFALQDILGTWRTCEGDLNAALAKETEEEQAWIDKGERTIPGGFSREDIVPQTQKPRETTRKALTEEAPMSLFDVTKNAAAALSKSAFPLRGQRQGIAAGNEAMEVRDPPSSPVTSESGEGPGRIRKRDIVSNMVTGGLASGIGWVIGKQPVSWAWTLLTRYRSAFSDSRLMLVRYCVIREPFRAPPSTDYSMSKLTIFFLILIISLHMKITY